MMTENKSDLYQEVILEHHHKPRNFGSMPEATHTAEGYNPLCGDHLNVYLKVQGDKIENISFVGDGCAISRASSSMMTNAVKGKTLTEAQQLYDEFHRLILGQLDPLKEANHLNKLSIFAGIWQYPSRVKCASLCWHTMKGALDKVKTVSTE